ncbi:S-locus lectin protein kinase family protein [Hibiscus syriacus]|uniref:S-locus lectin protein kinase family protein n=1 Tax=Hibiscus syriacus TaxID=106335 RepID=A0A6A3AF33_HIBSY|nr:S-locus lectin protein kinase family protein [Hibiscus syriacus]
MIVQGPVNAGQSSGQQWSTSVNGQRVESIIWIGLSQTGSGQWVKPVWTDQTGRTTSIHDKRLEEFCSSVNNEQDGGFGSKEYIRSGLWNGNDFSGYRNLRWNTIFDNNFVRNENEVYFIQYLKNKSVMSRGVLNQTDSARERVQSEMARKMELIGYSEMVRKNYGPHNFEIEDKNVNDKANKNENEDMELALFGFRTIAQATDTFAFHNKLEYATDGLFSVKSDVFSYGILLLEVISGRKNRGFYHENESDNLIEHSHPEERPCMSSVIHMLGSHNQLPPPKQPDFLFYKKRFEADSSPDIDRSSSRNEISLSLLEAR